MCLEALYSSLIVLDKDVRFLSIENLPEAVGASCSTSIFSCEILDYKEYFVFVTSHVLSARTIADTSDHSEVLKLLMVHVLPTEA